MTREELLERQSWSLEKKIDHSLGVIEDFYAQLNGKVAVSFSGGKDRRCCIGWPGSCFQISRQCFAILVTSIPTLLSLLGA